MNSPPRANTRLIAAAATLLVIATPIVLAATTLAPLESAPRGGRTTVVEEAAPADGTSVDTAEPSSDQQPGSRRNRRNRDRDKGQDEAADPELGTPAP
jgi:hypothetical protein